MQTLCTQGLGEANKFSAAVVAASLLLTASLALAQAPTVNGEVKKVDETAAKITLKHGPIKNLDMEEDSMTMVFRVQDPAMLKSLKADDKVRFDADRVNGQITVTGIQKAK